MRSLVRSLAVSVLFIAAVLGFSSPALAAAPKATAAGFTNPVAYELKSLLATRFYYTVDQVCWGTLTVSGAKGVVKTVFDEPMTDPGKRLYSREWNGLDASGKRLPSGSYDWKLVMKKGSHSTTVTGKITISKINFVIRGARSSAEGGRAQFSRYMIPGTANVYATVRASQASAGKFVIDGPFVGKRFLYRETFSTGGGKTLHTGYIRNPTVPARGIQGWSTSWLRRDKWIVGAPGEPARLADGWTEYDITVIQ